jgi:hypothetical protein
VDVAGGGEISPSGSHSNYKAGLLRVWSAAFLWDKELFDFIRNREAKKQAVAVAVQPEVWGEGQPRARGRAQITTGPA